MTRHWWTRAPLTVVVSEGAPAPARATWNDPRTTAQRASDQARTDRDFPRWVVRP